MSSTSTSAGASRSRAVQVDPMKPKLKPGTKRLKLKCDIMLSTFAFNFNLRRYIAVPAPSWTGDVEVGSARNRPVSVYCFPRRALTLCPKLRMGIQPGARFPARSADALPATLYGHFTPVIHRNRPVAQNILQHVCQPSAVWVTCLPPDVLNPCSAESLRGGHVGATGRAGAYTRPDFSAQLEPCLTQENILHTICTP
jgi:hypothetical protein